MAWNTYTVRPDIWDDKTKICQVRKWRHTVIFPGGGTESTVTYCNRCGSPAVVGDESDKNDRCLECNLPMPPDYAEAPSPYNT